MEYACTIWDPHTVDLILLYKTQSSAKSLTVDPVEITSSKSLMKSMNNSGPSTLPWGTPDWTGAEVDVLLDFSKAFDKVPHERLLYKMEYYGIRGHMNSWIRDFLENRQQQVVLE
jgi:hypothetical protein